MNWNGGSSMPGVVLNSRFFERLLTSGKEDFKRVSMLKEDTSTTACEVKMLILSISVTFSATCLTIASLIMKSCQQRWPIHSCSFYKVVHLQIWRLVVDFMVYLVTVNFCLQQWKNYYKKPSYCWDSQPSVAIFRTQNTYAWIIYGSPFYESSGGRQIRLPLLGGDAPRLGWWNLASR